MSSNLPNFLVIGAQRCATSWLYFCLKEHPEVFLPYIKEISYFSRYHGNGLDWYKRYFELSEGKKAVGEVTPAYLYYEKAPQRIHETLPDAKLIVIFRNPADRAFSQYQKHVKRGTMKVDFETALKEDKEYIERGFYCTQLKRYLASFKREQVLVMIYEDLLKNLEAYLAEIFRFIGVDAAFMPPSASKIIPSDDLNSGLYKPVTRAASFAREKLGMGGAVDMLKKTKLRGYADRLLQAFGPAPSKNKGVAAVKRVPMNSETRKILMKRFEPEIAGLEQLLSRDLSIWRSS